MFANKLARKIQINMDKCYLIFTKVLANCSRTVREPISKKEKERKRFYFIFSKNVDKARQVRTSVRTSQEKSEQVRKSLKKSEKVRTSQDKSGQVRTSQDKTA